MESECKPSEWFSRYCDPDTVSTFLEIGVQSTCSEILFSTAAVVTRTLLFVRLYVRCLSNLLSRLTPLCTPLWRAENICLQLSVDMTEGYCWFSGTDMCRLATGILSEKCVVRRFRRCANVIECTYTNLDSIAYYRPRLYSIDYFC